MAVSFPASPTIGQTYTEGNRQWTWDGVAWYASTPAITAQPADPDLDAISALSGAGLAARTGASTWALRTLTAGDGMSVANGDGAAGNPEVAVNSTVVRTTREITTSDGIAGGGDMTADRALSLTGQALAIHQVSSNGIIARTSAGVFTPRTIVGGDGVDVTFGAGVNGDPSIAVDSSVVRTSFAISTGTGLTGGGNFSTPRTFSLNGQALAIHNLTGTGIVVRDGGSSFVVRSLVGGDGINMTNGSGVSGAPTIAVDSSVVRTTREVNSGNGLTGGGTLANNRTISMGTPSSITATSVNEVTSGSHTHAITENTIRTLISQGAHGALGTYAFLRRGLNQNIVRGTSYTSSDGLRYAGITTRADEQNDSVENANNDAPSGTWQAMGTVGAVSTRYSMTLFLRITP
jgi:hypothetical protein